MSALLIASLIIIYTSHGMCAKLYSSNYPGESRQASPVYSVYYCLIVAAATLAASGFAPAISPTTVIFGLFNSAALIAYNTSLIRSAERGPYSVVMIVSLFGGILVPLASSALFFRGKPGITQWAAIGIVLVSFLFLNHEGGGKRLRDSVRPGFFAYCGLLFLSNGIYGAILDAQQTVLSGTENNGLTVVTYTSAGLISLVLLLVSRRRRAFADLKLNVKSTVYMLVCAGCVTAGIMITMFALSKMNVGVLYTAENGGVLLLSVLVSALVFKERLTATRIIGAVLATAGVVLLSIP